MAVLAAVCGVLIAGFGVLATGRSPSQAEFAIEISCFVGGVVLCFLAVVIARLGRLERQLGATLALMSRRDDETDEPPP